MLAGVALEVTWVGLCLGCGVWPGVVRLRGPARALFGRLACFVGGPPRASPFGFAGFGAFVCRRACSASSVFGSVLHWSVQGAWDLKTKSMISI